jgi:hypothetical protein
MQIMRTPFRPVLAVCVAWSALCLAQTVYEWTDKSGEVHYTDDKSSIPKGAKVRTTDGAALAEVSSDTPPPKPQPSEPQPTVQMGPPGIKGPSGPSDAEQYWRGEYRRVRENIRRLEDEIEVDKRKVEDPSGLPVNHMQCGIMPGGTFTGAVPVTGQMGCYYLPNPEYQRTKDRLETDKRALKRAKDELNELDRRAANDAIPLEWRR